MKKLMIMGAGIYQVPLLKKAKEMGIYTIAVSIPGNYPGFEVADQVCYENTVDYEKVLEIAKREKIDGIVTAGTDVAVITIGRVCDEMGLSGLSFEAAKIASNKILMKKKYEEYGVRTARFRELSFEDDMYEKVKELNFPLIFKAIDSSGSRGIIRVNALEEFEAARSVVKSITRNQSFIIEEFVEGEEFGAQAFVYHGEVKFILPHGDYVFQGDTGVPVGHFAPYNLDETVIDDMKVQLTNAVRAMGLDNCAINADFILKDNQTYVLELGGRSGATCLAELVSIYYGYDYYEKLILAALGEEVEFPQTQAVPNASMLLRSDRDGVITSIENRNQPDDDIYEIQFDYKVGDPVKKFHVGPHRIGHVVTKGDTLEGAVDKLHEVLEHIKITVQ
ncbi:MAG: ATP-grasp domain-containing protein [Lachnospiraceae bacterium]|jgi:biotin carboxylase|nr:ATP-grasp domain-containing protein [Lachnospiraceae bacterium]RKJ48883.1 ATP-grasp domain-containing protein [bacterium 1XD42-54]